MKNLIFACLLALLLPGPGAAAAEVRIETARGAVTVPETPDRVVALDFAALDTLTALGVPLAGRPDLDPPAYLSDALAQVPAMGTIFEPDIEALAALGPDLILAGGRTQAKVAALERVAPTLDMTIDGRDLLAEARGRLLAYGQLFDRTARARDLAADLDRAVARTRAAMAGKGRALIVVVSGAKASVYGAQSRFGWLHRDLDLPEAVPDLHAGTHGEAVSFEFLAEADPDWLLVIDRDAAIGQAGQAARATLDNPLVAGTRAAERGQIVFLDGAAMYLADGGIRSLMLVLGQLLTAFGGPVEG